MIKYLLIILVVAGLLLGIYFIFPDQISTFLGIKKNNPTVSLNNPTPVPFTIFTDQKLEEEMTSLEKDLIYLESSESDFLTGFSDKSTGKVQEARNTTLSREKTTDSVISRSSWIIDRLQTRMDQSDKKDISEVYNLITDTEAKLRDAKVKLSEVDSKRVGANKQADFEVIKGQFKIILNNLRVSKENEAKIIGILKGGNPPTPSTQKP